MTIPRHYDNLAAIVDLQAALQKTIAVIPSIRGAELLRRLGPTLDLPPGQIIVVDQASADGTEELCRDLGWQCLQMGKQLTFTQASNAGIQAALDRGAEHVALLNNDIELTTPVIHQLLESA